ncbi:MAG TPA: CPBP family intramembrane glutamic endopeptidase [Candidatus Dormibacteraeota bacterium]|nr:CPBP family intramembrane glutamic endopeptidase [Candidatus Dormibacteraeota bacterium]
MPVSVRDKAESVDRYFYFLVYALTAGFVLGLMWRSNLPAARVGLRVEHWGSNLAIGVSAGGLLVLLQALIHRLLPTLGQPKTTDRFQRRSVGLWVLVFLVAAATEEFWIAYCIVSMTATGRSGTTAVMVTAVVFGAMHLGYRLFGALSVAARAAMSAILFLWLGSLIPMVLFHFMGNLGNLYWLRRPAGAR